MDKKCHFCKTCNGKACVGQIPGMGGPMENQNFILNYEGWEKIKSPREEDFIPNMKIRLAPMTGGVENVGYQDEKTFYFDLIKGCRNCGAELSIGDGCPDEKLFWGIEAVKNMDTRASVFIKPYPQEKIFERMERSFDIAESCGIDIDAFNIATMREKVHLEKKTPSQLREIKKYLNGKGLPFIVKGIFTKDDLDLTQELKPDVAFVSNHGGRIETRIGSTAEFLYAHKDFLKRYSGEIWVDGGIRNYSQARTAFYNGASEILIGRPFASAILKDKDNGCKKIMDDLTKATPNNLD